MIPWILNLVEYDHGKHAVLMLNDSCKYIYFFQLQRNSDLHDVIVTWNQSYILFVWFLPYI